MKSVGKMIIAVLCICLLAGGAGCTFLGRSSSEKLKFLHIWPEHGVAMSNLINQFMIENEGIEVEIMESSYSDVDTTLRNSWGTRDMPDVFFQWSHYMPRWVAEDIPLDITDIVEEAIDEMISDGAPARSGMVNGKYYSMPFRSTGYAIIYNKAIFANNPEFKVPETIEELEQLLEVIKSKQFVPLAAYGGATGTFLHFINAFNTFAAILSGQVEDPNFSTGRLRPDLTDDAGAYAMIKTQKWLNYGYFGSYSSREAVQQAFINGSAAMAILNNNELGELSKAMPGVELGIYAIPAPEEIKSEKYVYGGFDGFSIASSTTKVEQAKKLLQFLASKEAQEAFGNSEKSCMINKNVIYTDSEQAIIANEMTYVGKYDVYPDFNSGSYGEINGNLVLNFVTGNNSSLAAAREVLATGKSNTEKAMADIILNKEPKTWIEPTFIKKTYDNSWLVG